jgi:hypothetical protein
MSTHAAAKAEDAREILRELVHQRQQLQREEADAQTLAANRLAIVYWQTQLSRARRSRSLNESS